MMRSWIFGKGEEKEDANQQSGSLQPDNRTPSFTIAAADAFTSFTRRGMMGSHDAEIERKVSLAARNLCYGVQRIVMAAKGKSGVEWKAELLTLLGGSDEQTPKDHCDMDVLLVAPKTDKFIMRCLENELPPNMIHCLRLLRVLELQHATQKHREMDLRGIDIKKKPIKPISSRATAKVSQLLCTLCTDQAVGEQLRPHLFGLLALSGASYPASGVHVAKAASEVIIAFAEHCLSESLVWFLHDRKMIIHMTDDIKELCGSTAGDANNANALSLYGVDAEEHGLWAISLSTVIHLVVNSCRHKCQELLNDFEDADGNQVLESAIVESKSKHGKKLMELLPLLATCRVSDDAEQDLEITSMADPNNHKLAMNPAAFEIMEDLMYRSIPLLKEYVAQHGEKPEITDEQSTRELAQFSLSITPKVRFSEGRAGTSNATVAEEPAFDIATDLLLACLNLFSEHTMNYELVEEHKSILSFYILSFSAFKDENLKVLVLKTIEFVVTGVTGSNALQPFGVLCEVFVSICKALLHGGSKITSDVETQKAVVDGLFKDTILINESLEKLFKFDSRIGPTIIRSGEITQKVDEITILLLSEILAKKDSWLTTFEDSGTTFSEPPSSTPLDCVCSALCRVLALIMGEQSKRNLSLLSIESEGTRLGDTNTLLVSAVKELGDESSIAASGVFETIMSSRGTLECLREDMEFCLKLVEHFTKITSHFCGVTSVAQKFASKKTLKRAALEDISFTPVRPLNKVFLRRIGGLYTMLKSVLQSSSLAREAFRLSGGFESIVNVVLSLGGVALQGDEDNEIISGLLDLFQTMLSVIDAAIGFNSRETLEAPDQEANKKLAITLRADTLVDPVSTQHSPANASVQNLYYIRIKRIYLDFAIAVSQTKILEHGENAVRVLEMAMSHMDPSFSFTRVDSDKNSKVQMMRNPDAARLVLGIVIFLPNTDEGGKLSKRAFDQIIRLCDPSRLGSTLSQIAGCGMIWSITNPREFAPILQDTSHPLYTRFTLLLRRIAAFSMSYNDFVSMIRSIAGPLLTDEKSDYRIRLPVLTSSVRRRIMKNEDFDSDAFKEKENNYCRRLESLSTVAEKAERVPYCTLGGDSINTLSVLLHKTKVEDRLYKAAEDGRLNFLEVECIDVSSLKPGGFLSAGVAAPGSSGGERIWTPLASTGFSYSLWFRYPKQTDENREGNVYLLDMSNPTISTGDGAHAPQSAVFLSLWYDLQSQCFDVLSSTSYRGEPTSFPTSPLSPGVWHHVLFTYTPTKRTMMGRKSVCALYVDGRPLEAEIKIESVNIAPNARVIIGAPNPAVAVSGVVRGMLPVWDLGPTLMLSTVLMELDATAMFIHGPEFEGLFWGDRPQRLSLSATGSAAFALLAETGEPGSVASALRRRDIARLEAAGTVSREMGLGVSTDEDNDSLASLGLLCTIPPDCVVFGYRAASCNPVTTPSQVSFSSKRRNCSFKLINMARINSTNEFVASDACTYGKAGVVIPRCFADNVQWAGGPQILMPLTYAATSSKSLALALRLIRASTMRHPPNLEAMQSGGGFQTLALVMHEKKLVDEKVLDQAFAFAVHGFVPSESDDVARSSTNRMQMTTQVSDYWVFSDLDAMKQLLLNHQVWDIKSSGPDLPLRLVSFMNGLVGQKSIHKAFNSRRLHLVGIVRWTLHLMIEAAELYTAGELSRKTLTRKRTGSEELETLPDTSKTTGAVWYSEAPNADAVAVGGDPDNPLLNACKTLLRRVLTFMLTPGDLEAIAEATMYTINVGGFNPKTNNIDKQKLSQVQALQGDPSEPQKLLPGAVTRIYLLRLVEELVVDGVNEIIASGGDKRGGEGDHFRPEIAVHQHSGGIANPNQAYLSTAMLGGYPEEGANHPKHNQAQSFLSAFANYFTPVWFAALLEGCHEEATASAVLRLMILMQQSSPTFAASFEAKGGFAPLVLSIPKFSTCPSIIISLLSQLLHVSILHLPCFPMLDAAQLNEVFESETELSELMSKAYAKAAIEHKSDPSCGVFSLLSECIGRNLQLAPYDNNLASKARQTNKAILELLAHRHNLSPSFQAFCKTPDFIEPLAQTLCLVYDEKLQKLEYERAAKTAQSRRSRRGSLSEVPQNISAMERYVGTSEESTGASGFGMVQLLRLVISNAVSSGPGAPPLVYSLFTSFPIHASAEQVGAYQLVLLDLVRSTVEDAIDLGEAAALACSIGVISVLLDRLMKGFFTSEPILQTVSLSLTLLKDLSSPNSAASQVIGNAELGMLTMDAAHIARLVCNAALKRSRPMSADDPGDPDLQAAVVQLVAKNIQNLMIVPKTGATIRRSGSNLHPAPAMNSKSYPLWLSASVSRCADVGVEFSYPDLSTTEEPLRMFVVALMVEVAVLLQDPRDNVREATVSIVVALLQQRRGIMSGILIKDILRGDRVETIDVMNRGGFGALLVAHEVAMSAGGSSAKKDYAAFFEWFERNQQMVQLVFDDIKSESERIFPSLQKGAKTTSEAVEVEQQAMVMKLSATDTSDRTIIGGVQRATVAQKCFDKTLVSHIHWRRQGFDDLASGAMQWKFLLRRLKGSRSLWEGGPRYESRSMIVRHQQLYTEFLSYHASSPTSMKENGEEYSGRELVTRWKLDLTEGSERQRRRLLPNYEFHSLYNVDENDDALSDSSDEEGEDDNKDEAKHHRRRSTMIKNSHEITCGRDSQKEFFISDGMEATAALLKELNIKTIKSEEDDEVEDEIPDEDAVTEATSVTTASSVEAESEPGIDDEKNALEDNDDASADEIEASESHDQQEAENASSYELIIGLLQAGDWPSQSYNVRRCTGLEVRKALLLWCKDAIYVIDGFEQAEGEGLDGKITRVEKEESSYNVSIRPKDFKVPEKEADGFPENSFHGGDNEEKNKSSKKATQESSNTEVTYQHRSQRIAFTDLHSVFRRRYQLQHNALEFYDIHNNGTLIAFANTTETEEILSKVLSTPLPNSIFNSSYGTSINYKKFMASWKSKTISQWMNGKMTNFEFLMHLNSFAGRTYNDLTQYPVFPWVIADYDSEEIDLDDPATYRDLSKPMGALGDERAQQFRDRYEALEANYFNDDEPPPFHYGTHYSCAAYVLYYLMRLEPFSRLALTLQGGRFDVADRLFHNIGSSWKSASGENLQDVRELIPEFFYLPDFLTNTNHFDFGTTQKGKMVHNVTLPNWAKGDPKRFIRINRQALESDYVSRNLHLWIDLIFGYKQRGEEAVKALNTFVHVTYEGAVDLDSMTDPIQRESTIAQIQNFGQTPSRLERKPFPQRFVFSSLKGDNLDFGSLSYLAPLTPPFCVVGAPHRCQVKRTTSDTCKLGVDDQYRAVGDMCLMKGQIIGVGRMCALHIPSKTYIRFGSPNNGMTVHVGSLTARNREPNKIISIHDGLHRAAISAAKISLNGAWLITGCIDSTVRVWKYESPSLKLRATLCGHGGWKITCLDVSTSFGTIVTGCAQGRVLLWDLRTLTFVRRLEHKFKDENETSASLVRSASSVSMNHINGNIVTLVGPHLSVFDVNGNLLGTENSLGARPTCAVATDCPEWQDQGIVAVTGHVNGEVRFWSLDYDAGTLAVRHLMVDREHTCEITSLSVTGVDRRQDTLLVGDQSGKMSVCKTVQLENMSGREIQEIVMELKNKPKVGAN